MTIGAALVLFAVVWFMVLFVVLPLRMKSQADAGDVVPGTPAGAPADPQIKRKMMITTIAALCVWAVLCVIIISGVISVSDFDVMGRLPARPTDGTGE